MNFAFTEEQLLLRDTVRALLERESEPWEQLDEIGVLDPSLTDLDLVLVFEEMGRAGLPGLVAERVISGDDDTFDRRALATAAQLVGLGARMIEMTVDYVKERRQFGVPVGSYQAVKHHLANAHLKVEYARPPVYRAAYALAHGEPQRARDVSFAKVYANEAAAFTAKIALQCHGAIGYSLEYGLHVFMKRAWVLGTTHGSTAFHRARVADAVIP